MTIEELWKHIERGDTVFWSNNRYKVVVDTADCEYQRGHFSHKNGKVLCVRDVYNYFGGLVEKSDMSELFSARG